MKRGIGVVLNVNRRRRLNGFKSGRLSHHNQAHNFHFLLKIHFPLWPEEALLLIWSLSLYLWSVSPSSHSLCKSAWFCLQRKERAGGDGWDLRGYFMVFELSVAHKIFSKICYSLTSCHQICFKNMQRNSMYLKVGKKRLFRSVFTSLVFIVSFHHICKFIDF